MIRAFAPLALAPVVVGCSADAQALTECRAQLAQLELERTTSAAEITARFAEHGVNVDPAKASPEQLEIFADMQDELQVHENKAAIQRARCNDLARKDDLQ